MCIHRTKKSNEMIIKEKKLLNTYCTSTFKHINIMSWTYKVFFLFFALYLKFLPESEIENNVLFCVSL